MTITGIITMLVIGSIIGSLGRLIIPGRYPIPIWVTIVVGVVAAFAGTLLAAALGVSTATPGIDWLELLFQVVLAATGVMVVAGMYSRRQTGDRSSAYHPNGEPPSRPTRGSQSSPTRTSSSALPSAAADPPGFRADTLSRRPASTPQMQQPVRRKSDVARPAPAPSRIFVSYRRTDSRYAARGIADRLRAHFGRTEVFMDVDSLDAGVDFVEGVLRAIHMSAVVLVLIGDHWLLVEDSWNRRRIDDPNDNVRAEIEYALQLKKPVLPVLLDGVNMPRPDELPGSITTISRLNAVRLDHVSWETDIAALIQAVTRMRS